MTTPSVAFPSSLNLQFAAANMWDHEEGQKPLYFAKSGERCGSDVKPSDEKEVSELLHSAGARAWSGNLNRFPDTGSLEDRNPAAPEVD